MNFLRRVFGKKEPQPLAVASLPPPPLPVPLPVIIKTTGASSSGRRRYNGPTAEDVMRDAVNEAHKAGEGNDPKKMTAWIQGARATYRAALKQMTDTNGPVSFSIGTINYTVEP